jgi:hypothetical protein
MEIYLKAIKQGIHVTYFKYKVKVFNIKISTKYQIQLQFQFKNPIISLHYFLTLIFAIDIVFKFVSLSSHLTLSVYLRRGYKSDYVYTKY